MIIKIRCLRIAFSREDNACRSAFGGGRSYPFPYLIAFGCFTNLFTFHTRPRTASEILAVIPAPAINAVRRIPIRRHLEEGIHLAFLCSTTFRHDEFLFFLFLYIVKRRDVQLFFHIYLIIGTLKSQLKSVENYSRCFTKEAHHRTVSALHLDMITTCI